MDSSQIEKALKDLTNNIDQESFLFDLLSIYDFPKASITRLKKGDGNLSKNEGEYLSKNKFLFKVIQDIDPLLAIDELGRNETFLKHRPRFLIVTDYKTFLAQDLKTCDSLDISINELADHHEFFFPWIGREKSKLVNEAVADIKAATKMGQLYDLIVENNPTFVSEKDKKHELNVFFAQLLFCLFAEDTGLFEDGIFKNTIATYSDEDGSDLNKVLSHIFQSLDAKDKSSFPVYCKNLPYVGGDLFKGAIGLPIFSRKARANIIEAGKLDWCEINPDIFGSMIQVISSPEDRASLGEHYTSVPNIMKVINPLFMDSLNEQFESCEKEKDYEKLLKQIYNLKIFDPASGSGNFLIVTYKKLCQLEFRIFSLLQEINPSKWTLASLGIRANQFYALTIQDFDAQIAKLSMYIAEHQMNRELSDTFGEVSPTLPFLYTVNVQVDNSLRIKWDSFCSKDNKKVYIIGNPPFLGSSRQSHDQKNDMSFVYEGINNFKSLDYISCWFFLASKYIQNTNHEFAFISTNSICQGVQVSMLWPNVFNKNLEISFCETSFRWRNNAKSNAAVYVVVVGLRASSKLKKYIFNSQSKKSVKNISPYLIDANNLIITSRSMSLSELPLMTSGNKPVDGGNLILNESERQELIYKFPEAKVFIKNFIGASEILNGNKRYCLWIRDTDLPTAKKIPFINNRISQSMKFRLNSKDIGANNLARSPHQFRDFFSTKKHSIVIPQTGSERREYLPIYLVDSKSIVSNAVRVIYESEFWIFSLLSSAMHMAWIKAVAGRLKMDMQYTNTLCYNTFPFPSISNEKKKLLSDKAFNIISEREKSSEKTMSQLYDPDKMPKSLREAHYQNDLEVDSCYRSEPFKSSVERLEYLLNLYENML